MEPNRSAVLYARISAQASPQRLAQVQQELVAAAAYARRQGLRVLDALIDRYGTRRTPRPELEKAIRLCGEFNACLVIPSIGKLCFRSLLLRADSLCGGEAGRAGRQAPDLRQRAVGRGVQALRADPRQHAPKRLWYAA